MDSHAANAPDWKTWLALGRVSNLPTVWSNCLAGWILGGGGTIGRFLEVTLAASCLYVAGMFLNDAFDAEFDREHRPERPIPRGQVREGSVWMAGLLLLVAGVAVLLPFGSRVLALSGLLAANILIYDALHKRVTFGPILMAGCRFWLFLMAAEAGDIGVSGFALWWAIALGLYIVGLSYIARCESKQGAIGYWPIWLLAAPMALAYIAWGGSHRLKILLLCAALALWIFRSVRYLFWTEPKQIGKTVSSLLAGMVLVDLLAVGGGGIQLGLVFLAFMGLALLFQRYVPAT